MDDKVVILLGDGRARAPEKGEDMLIGTEPTGTTLRRQGRMRTEARERRKRIGELISRGASGREMYEVGEQDGLAQQVDTLSDILFCISEGGLGRASIVQESNSHVIFKVFDCACCELGVVDGCFFLAGFIAGALRAADRPGSVRVREIACGEFPGRTCVFAASW